MVTDIFPVAASAVRVRLTSMLDQNLSFDMDLAALSDHGFTGATRWPAALPRRLLGPFWADVDLPGTRQHQEYVVRPAHRSPGDDGHLSRWIFCDADDATPQRAKLAHLRMSLAASGPAARAQTTPVCEAN